MEPYSASHLAAIAVFVVGVVPVVLLGRRERRTGHRTASRVMAVAIPVVFVPTQIVDLTTNFELRVSLPLHLCDLAWVAASVALWTQNRLACALTYFWGLVLTTQGIATPSLGEDFPELRYFAYWALHLLIVWAAVLVVWGLRVTPSWRDYREALLVTLGWVVVAYAFNLVADTNYGYLIEKPRNGSVLDLLGPWPIYVIAEIAIVAAIWALLTWPWNRTSAPRIPAAR
ncbi:TIGR02206 family membrane protein [Nocardioides sp. R-C-SC26]|uniref:YwaF family protein n=1 Tax=Nocardioides sp. R-C-SC26 TaxID=2870414 RepID=UPI001E5AD8CE|nr:TIGR02206 family membrane protein [Nocardioides sp. R-C-SC26]